MRTKVPEKLLAVVEEIDSQGYANLTRLTVLKKWFEPRGRLPGFGLWIARRSAGQKGKTKGTAGALLDEARLLLGTSVDGDRSIRKIDLRTARSLHRRARDFQNEYDNQSWGPVRIINCWPLLLMENGLAIWLGEEKSPSEGYKLAADFCQHYDSRHGNCLCGPSRTKIRDVVRFMFTVEAIENDVG